MQDPLSFKLESTGDVKRDQAVATRPFSAGDLILSARPLATVLLPYQKGRRCDCCLRPLCSTLRCSACKQYWYCDRQCSLSVPLHTCHNKANFVSFSVQAKRKIGAQDTNAHVAFSRLRLGNHLPNPLLCWTFWTQSCSFISLQSIT
jgi:hypothetical protein